MEQLLQTLPLCVALTEGLAAHCQPQNVVAEFAAALLLAGNGGVL